MIRKIYTLLILGLCLGFAACGDDNDGLDPNAAAPVINATLPSNLAILHSPLHIKLLLF